MRTFVYFAAAAALGLSVAPRLAQAGGTNLVYTYGRAFSLGIPADPDASLGRMQDAIIDVPSHLVIADLNVFVRIRHTAVIDLQLFLVSPAGTAIILNMMDPFEGYQEGADYDSTTFDDEAADCIVDARPPFAGIYQPLQPLSAFDGQDAYGSWRLQVYDAQYDDRGHLEYFALTIATSSEDPFVPVPAPAAGGLALLGLTLIGPGIRRRAGARKVSKSV